MPAATIPALARLAKVARARVVPAVTRQLPGQTAVWWLFPLAMACAGAATGLTDVLMNARVAAIETQRGLHLMNLAHAAYSFGYAGGAVLTALVIGVAWGAIAGYRGWNVRLTAVDPPIRRTVVACIYDAAPTRNRLSKSSLLLCGRNHALCVSSGSSPCTPICSKPCVCRSPCS